LIVFVIFFAFWKKKRFQLLAAAARQSTGSPPMNDVG